MARASKSPPRRYPRRRGGVSPASAAPGRKGNSSSIASEPMRLRIVEIGKGLRVAGAAAASAHGTAPAPGRNHHARRGQKLLARTGRAAVFQVQVRGRAQSFRGNSRRCARGRAIGIGSPASCRGRPRGQLELVVEAAARPIVGRFGAGGCAGNWDPPPARPKARPSSPGVVPIGTYLCWGAAGCRAELPLTVVAAGCRRRRVARSGRGKCMWTSLGDKMHVEVVAVAWSDSS